MRIFVAGATGAIGQRLVPLLASAGYAVVGLTRTPGKAAFIRTLGAEAAVADALDADPGLFDGPFVDQVRRRRAPLIGDGSGWWSFVHIDDAVEATALAIERGKAGNIYNIVDDDPARVREWLPALARMLGAKPPFN